MKGEGFNESRKMIVID